MDYRFPIFVGFFISFYLWLAVLVGTVVRQATRGTSNAYRVYQSAYFLLTKTFVLSQHNSTLFLPLHCSPFPPFILLPSSGWLPRVVRSSEFVSYASHDAAVLGEPFSNPVLGKSCSCVLVLSSGPLFLTGYVEHIVYDSTSAYAVNFGIVPSDYSGHSGSLITQNLEPIGIFSRHRFHNGHWFTILSVEPMIYNPAAPDPTVPLESFVVPTFPVRLAARMSGGKTRTVMSTFCRGEGRFLFVCPTQSLASDLYTTTRNNPKSTLYQFNHLIGISTSQLVDSPSAKVLIRTSYGVVSSLLSSYDYLSSFSAIALDEFDYDSPVHFALYHYCKAHHLPVVFISATFPGLDYGSFPPVDYIRPHVSCVSFPSTQILLIELSRIKFRTALFICPTIAQCNSLSRRIKTIFPNSEFLYYNSTVSLADVAARYCARPLSVASPCFVMATSPARVGVSLSNLDVTVEMGNDYVPGPSNNTAISKSAFVQSYGRPGRDGVSPSHFFYSSYYFSLAKPFEAPSDSLTYQYVRAKLGLSATDLGVSLSNVLSFPSDGRLLSIGCHLASAFSRSADTYASSLGIVINRPPDALLTSHPVQAIDSLGLTVQCADGTFIGFGSQTHNTTYRPRFLSPLSFLVGTTSPIRYVYTLDVYVSLQAFLVFCSFATWVVSLVADPFPLADSLPHMAWFPFVSVAILLPYLIICSVYPHVASIYNTAMKSRPGQFMTSGLLALFYPVVAFLSLGMCSSVLSFVVEVSDLHLRVARDLSSLAREARVNLTTYSPNVSSLNAPTLFSVMFSFNAVDSQAVISTSRPEFSYGSFGPPGAIHFVAPFSLLVPNVKFTSSGSNVWVCHHKAVLAVLSHMCLVNLVFFRLFHAIALILFLLSHVLSRGFTVPLFVIFLFWY